MRSRALLALALLLVVPWAAAAPPPLRHEATLEVAPTPRGSIDVVGDAGLLDPLSGVRGGSGTAADPYRISGYVLAHDRVSALRLTGTRAHVLIEDVVVPRQPTQAGIAAECVGRGQQPLCDLSRGIDLVDVENVTVRNVLVESDTVPFRVFQSRHVVLDRVQAGTTEQLPLRPRVGILVHESQNVTIRSATVDAASFPVQLADTDGVRVESSLFNGTLSDGRDFHVVWPAANLTVVDSVFLDVNLRIDDEIHGLTLLRNRFLGRDSGVGDGFGLVFDGNVCGNLIRGAREFAGVAFAGGERISLRHNRIENGAIGVSIGPASDVELVGNLVSNSTNEGVWLSATPAILRNNSIFGNGLGNLFTHNGIDARHNWWGAADGPFIGGSGSGDAITLDPGVSLDYAPWLTSPAVATPDCGDEGAPRAPVTPPRSYAEARVRVVLDAGPARADVVLEAGAPLLP